MKYGKKIVFISVLFLWVVSVFFVGAEETDPPAYEDGEILVVFDTGVSDGIKTLEADDASVTEVGSQTAVVELEDGQSVEDAVEEYSRLPGVLSVQPNYIYYLIEDTDAALANDPELSRQWYLENIHIDGAWQISKTEGAVKVAVIDSGIEVDHPDLVNNIDKTLSWDFVKDTALETDSVGHGTHVAGIIAAQVNNGLGVAGVSYNAQIIGYNVFEGGKAKTSDIQKAINQAVSDGARVINMSLGGYGSSYEKEDHVLRTAIQQAVNNNVVVVCAGGNGIDNVPQTQPCYPADYEECISVTAAKQDNTWPSYDYNIYKDIAAPGYSIYSTVAGGSYGYKSGTSMAAPMVSGVVAMMLAKDPDLTVDQVKEILYSTATDIGEEGKDEYFGNGLMNAEKALKVVNGEEPEETGESETKETETKESETKETETKEPETKETETKEPETKETETKEPETDPEPMIKDIGIQYRTHVQTYGWQDWVSDGDMSGTSGQSKRLEAIQIQLTGSDADKYDVYYRVHAQTYGWLDWAKNGEAAGTSGYSKRLEGIQIVVKKKGEAAPGSTDRCYIERPGDLAYRTHVQTFGWQNWVSDGAMSGTSGQSKRLEAIEIKLINPSVSGNIQYKTHVQTYGWQNWASNGSLSGTSGQSKRLEAIQIKLTDDLADKYDIYYRVHAQTYGWLGWAKNGQSAGTEGLSKRLEAIEIQILPKGSPAPGSTDNCFVK